MNVFDVLQSLTETPGPSGYEQDVVQVIRAMWEPLVDSLEVDRVGSLVAIKQGKSRKPRKRVLLAAHADEIGLMVTKLVGYPAGDADGAGFLRVTNIGGVDRRQIIGQPVTVHGRESFLGVVGALPNKMLPADKHNAPHSYDDLVVDTGLPLKALQEKVAVGDVVTFRQPLRKLLNGQVTGKALDNRASVAVVAVCLDYLQTRLHAWDVVAVATAQEETRLLGAFTSSHVQRPDVAIALDVTFGKGPGAKDNGRVYDLDGGPTNCLGPNMHTGVFERLQKTAKDLEMKVPVEPMPRHTGTDAFGLQVARSGVPTGLIGIPLRYMHTMVETLALKDIERAGRLLGEFIAHLDDDFLDELNQGLMEAE